MELVVKNETAIAAYLASRGVTGFRINSSGRFGLTGPKITIEGSDAKMSSRLSAVCQDALLSRGGGGIGGCIYRQIIPGSFSHPSERALSMLESFERDGHLSPSSNWHLWLDEARNIVSSSGLVSYARDARTEKLGIWVDAERAAAEHH